MLKRKKQADFIKDATLDLDAMLAAMSGFQKELEKTAQATKALGKKLDLLIEGKQL